MTDIDFCDVCGRKRSWDENVRYKVVFHQGQPMVHHGALEVTRGWIRIGKVCYERDQVLRVETLL